MCVRERQKKLDKRRERDIQTERVDEKKEIDGGGKRDQKNSYFKTLYSVAIANIEIG